MVPDSHGLTPNSPLPACYQVPRQKQTSKLPHWNEISSARCCVAEEPRGALHRAQEEMWLAGRNALARRRIIQVTSRSKVTLE